jgi:hypothetical protein
MFADETEFSTVSPQLGDTLRAWRFLILRPANQVFHRDARCASVIPANRASTYCGVPVRSSQSCNDAYGLRFFMMSEVFSESMNLSSGYFSLGEESLRRMNGGRILGRYGR